MFGIMCQLIYFFSIIGNFKITFMGNCLFSYWNLKSHGQLSWHLGICGEILS